MIAIIRIKGMVKVAGNLSETLDRLRLKQKFACVVVREIPQVLGMIKKVRSLIAYGPIDKATLVKLIKARGKILPLQKVAKDDKQVYNLKAR